MIRRTAEQRAQYIEQYSLQAAKRREFEKKRQARTEAQAAYPKLLKKQWDACDAVWLCEEVIRKEAPKDPDEPWSERFCCALRNVVELREYRDRVTDEVWEHERNLGR